MNQQPLLHEQRQQGMDPRVEQRNNSTPLSYIYPKFCCSAVPNNG